MPALSSAKSKAVSSSFFPLFLTTCTGFARLDPKMFGHSNNRLRTWRICYHRQHRKWSCQWSLDELASMILCPKTFAPELNYSIYLRPMPPLECIRERDLTECLDWNYNGEITCELMLFSGSGPLAFSFSFTLNAKLRCQLRHLQKFWAMVPNKKLFDLSANVDKRKRTEAQHSVLPCLTTSSQLWFLVW